MTTPRLEIFLNEESDLCIAKVEKANAETRLIVNVPLSELESLGAENAAYRVGGTVLSILKIWHKETFKNLEVPPVDENSQSEDFYVVALRLIDHALSEKTAIHNASIEILLQRAATNNEAAKKYLAEAWPLLRDRLK